MKYLLTIFSLFFFVYYSYAQTQQGIVKTRGRIVNGQLVAGQRLTGATVTLNFGNPLVSGNQGSFSFNVPTGKNFSLVAAKKQGYTLADPEYTRRSFSYSASNPFYVVLEDENQRQADINAATRKVRKTLTAQLEKREEEIEALKAQNKITEKEYQERLQQLYDDQSNSEKLVKEMAERYASTDYDQLDEFNRKVQVYIEEGELQKADSMIRSKGDMEKRVELYRNLVDANKNRRAKIESDRKEVELSERGAAKMFEELSKDLYSKYNIFRQYQMPDSALYYLKMRADVIQQAAKLNPEEYTIDLQDVLHEIGVLYYDIHDYETCEMYFKLSLEALREHCRLMGTDNYGIVADRLSVIAEMYSDIHDNENSEKYYLEAIKVWEELCNREPDEYRKHLAWEQRDIADFYEKIGNYKESIRYYEMTLEPFGDLFRNGDDEYKGWLPGTQFKIGKAYAELQDYENAVKYSKQALENLEKLRCQLDSTYGVVIASVQHFLGAVSFLSRDYVDSEKYLKLALDNYEVLFQKSPDEHRAILSFALCWMAKCYSCTKRIDEAYVTIDKALKLTSDDADFYDTKGEILLLLGKNNQALEMWKKVLELNPNFLEENPDGTNLSNGLKKQGLIE